MYCELAAECFDIMQSQGLQAAMRWCQTITGAGYEIAGFLLSQLCDTYEVEAIAKETDPLWIRRWAERLIPAPQPKRAPVKVRFTRIQYLWQYRVMIGAIFHKETHRPYRYTPRFNHFEITDIHGDRHEIYTPASFPIRTPDIGESNPKVWCHG